jgi:hypothetical protein
MKTLKHDINQMIFQRVSRMDASTADLDGPMLTLLNHMDGHRTISQIANETGLSVEQIRGVLAGLLSKGLAMSVIRGGEYVDERFFSHLRQQLALAVGPAADILVDDEIDMLGVSVEKFRTYLTMEIIERLGAEIDPRDRRQRFLGEMMAYVKRKGYLASRMKGALE